MENIIVCGDALEVLKTFPSEFIQCVITSPPYWGLRDYQLPPIIWDNKEKCSHDWGNKLPKGGRIKREEDTDPKYAKDLDNPFSTNTTSQFCQKCNSWKGSLGLEPTPELYVQHVVQIFRELRRVLRKDGTVWLNLGDSYWSDTLSRKDPVESMWGNRPASDLSSGRDSIPKNNVRGGLGKRPEGLKPKDLCGIPWRVAFALQADGWYLRSDIIWSKSNPMPESVTDRPTKSHEYIFLLTKSANYFYDADAIREESVDPESHKGRRFRGPKAIVKANVRPNSNPNTLDKGNEADGKTYPKRNKRSVWTIPTEPFSEAHFATFPKKLVAICIKAGTSEWGQCVECGSPWERIVEKERSFESGSGKAGHIPVGKNPDGVQGGGETLDIRRGPTLKVRTVDWQPTCKCKAEREPQIVLDPFSGSGTTLLIARKLSRKYIGIDLSKDYIKMSNRRLAQQEIIF